MARQRASTQVNDVRVEKKEGKRVWGRTVYFGLPEAPRAARRYYYTGRDHARRGDISDRVGEHGRVL